MEAPNGRLEAILAAGAVLVPAIGAFLLCALQLIGTGSLWRFWLMLL